MKIILAQPRGFCAGVDRAIEIVERALQIYGAPVYVRHEIVHNKYVVEDLRRKGAVFVKEVDDIPEGGITIFSAHGVSEKVENSAKARKLPLIDATCPLVTKVHKEAQRSEAEDRQIILIGHKGHPEVEGTSGRVKQDVLLVSSIEDVEKLVISDECRVMSEERKNTQHTSLNTHHSIKDPNKLAYVTQTTLSVDDTRNIIEALKKRFPNIKGPELRDICYATQNRQDAVKKLAKMVDVLLVVGAKNSSNSNRLRDLGEEIGAKSYLIDGAENINPSWLDGAEKIGITAGASAPEILVEQVIEKLKKLGNCTVETMNGTVENIKFKLPENLKNAAA